MTVTLDPNGYSIIPPSFDTLNVYVSSSIGSDTNDGLAPTNQGGNVGPKRTFAAAKLLLPPNTPWRLNVRAGDVFTERIGDFMYASNAPICGRSTQEPGVVQPYGAGPAPRWDLSNFGPVVKWVGTTGVWQYVYFFGFDAANVTGLGQAFIAIWGRAIGIWCEDCSTNGTSTFADLDAPYRKILCGVRRCNAINVSGDSAVRLSYSDGLIVEDCCFDGQVLPDNTGTPQYYAAVNETGPCIGTTVRGSAFNDFAMGARLIGAGSVEYGNLALQSAHGFQIGNWVDPNDWATSPYDIRGVMQRNLVLELRDKTVTSGPALKGGDGFILANLLAGMCVNNMATQNTGTKSGASGIRVYGKGLQTSGVPAGVLNTLIAHNRLYKWQSAGGGFSGKDIRIEVTPGTPAYLYALRIEQNDIQEKTFTGSNLLCSIDVAPSFITGGGNVYPPTAITSKLNRFFSSNAGHAFFDFGGAGSNDIANWQFVFSETALSTETDLSGTYTNPALTAGGYASSIGLTATTAALRAAMRANRKSNFDARLLVGGYGTTTGILQAFEAALA